MAKRKPARGSRQEQQARAQKKRGLASRTGRGDLGGDGPARVDPATTTAAAPSARPAGRGDVDWWYVDVAAIRIQQWLGRTPSLRGLRGASYLLSEATSQETIEAVLTAGAQRTPPGVEWNPETGQISGVASVRFPATGTDEDAARAVAGAVAARAVAGAIAAVLADALRTRCPGLSLTATWGRGPDYLAAYPDMRARARGSAALLLLPAPANESPTTRPCDLCQASPATHPDVQIPKRGTAQLCGDCFARIDSPAFGLSDSQLDGQHSPGFSSSRDPRYLPRAQRRVRDALTASLPQGSTLGQFPADFAALANTRTRSDDAQTHLALISADGNRIGATLDELAKNATSPKADVVAQIDEATKGAVVAATLAACPLTAPDPAGVVPAPRVIAHLADGDDVLVSVPAEAAWSFVIALMKSFGQSLAPLAAAARIAPTLSVGMVFHHASEPFADVVDRADGLLKQAKRDVLGREASVRFLDMTADGPAPIGSRTLRLTDLASYTPLLNCLAQVPTSHRTTLLRLLRDAQGPPAAGWPLAQETPIDALARRVTTMGVDAVWEVVAGPRATAEDVQRALHDDPGSRLHLRTMLDIARWWPAQPANEVVTR